MAEINRHIQKLLDEYLAWNAIRPDYAFAIDDIWGVGELLDSTQNYYFFGSKGCGKSSLITIAEKKIIDSNSAIPCVVHSSRFENDSPSDLFLTKVLNDIFNEIIKHIKTKIDREQKKWFFATYVGGRNYLDIRKLSELTDRLLPRINEKPQGGISSFLSQSRLELSSGIGNIELSALNTGPIRLGNISITPIQLGFKITPNDQPKNPSKQVEDIESNIQSQLVELITEASIHLNRIEIEKVVILLDDFHMLPLSAQLQIIKALFLLRTNFSRESITLSFKIFSATDLSVDILNTIGISTVNEIQYENIEASLDRRNRDTKRRAMENRLVSLLTLNGVQPNVINQKFPREIIDWVFTLSGGHFRRAWKIFSKILDSDEGQISYDTLEKSAAEVTKEFRDNLLVQVGINKESYGSEYKNWYNLSIQKMVKFFQKKKSAYFMVSDSDKNKHPVLVQWINDAIATGDILEIAKDIIIEDKKHHKIHYWLLALNQATIRGELGFSDFKITYQDVVDLQLDLQEMNKVSSSSKQLLSKV